MSRTDLQLDAVAEHSFPAKLLQIDGDLHQADIQALKFLFKDHLPKSKLAKMTSGHELFRELEASKLVTAKDPWLLVEVFKVIGRLDLIDILDVDENAAETFKTTGKISDYRYMLFDIAQDLTKDDASKLGFLAENISKAKREKLTSAFDLFSLMEESREISPNSLDVLKEHMGSLKRQDLVDRISSFSDNQKCTVEDKERKCGGSNELESMGLANNPQLTQRDREKKTNNGLPLGIRLDLSQELVHQPVSSITALWKELGYTSENLQRLDEAMKSCEEVFKIQKLLESAPLLHGIDMSDSLTKLINSLRFANLLAISRQLVTKFKDHLPIEYVIDVERHTLGEDNMNMQVSTGEATQLSQSCQFSPVCNHLLTTEMRRDWDQSVLPTYKMDANPRGICVIFNNSKFWHDGTQDSEKLKDRVGSDTDAEKLQKVFEKLHFKVLPCKDTSAVNMCHILEEISKDSVKRQHDCFVCCVLTHGKNGEKIYGSDGHLIGISDLQNPFKATRCPNLAGKPKLFFMQACQGQEKQEGMEVQSDISMETDGPDMVTVPNEADFLIGYSTAPGFVSYRSKTHGSWYIGILTELLDKLGTTCDLLSILTKVNHEVGKKHADTDGMRYKQSPAPQYTLRKRVIFKELE